MHRREQGLVDHVYTQANQQRMRLTERQPGELQHLHDAFALQLLGQMTQALIAGDRALGADDHQRQALVAHFIQHCEQQLTEKVEAGRVGPVQIVQHDEQGLMLRRIDDPVDDSGEEAQSWQVRAGLGTRELAQ
jgi:hypothetical protein